MDDASRLPQLNCKMRPSPAIPAPTQNQGKQRQKVSSGRAKVTGGGKTTQQNPNGHPDERPRACKRGTPAPTATPSVTGESPATGSPTNLDIKMHKCRFKRWKEVRVTDQESFSSAHPWWKSAGWEVNSDLPRRGFG